MNRPTIYFVDINDPDETGTYESNYRHTVLAADYDSELSERDARIAGLKRAWNERDVRVTELEVALKAQQPSVVQICKLGIYGKAYDAPGTRRAYTYADQPDNGGAWQLGEAAREAYQNGGGDLIDYGLVLLRALQERGFGVFEIAAPSAQQEDGEP